MVRPELVAWVIVHGTGVVVASLGIHTSISLAARPGRQLWPVLRGISSTCALLIHAASIFVGTAVIADLSPGYVWGYAIFQGGMFITISSINTLASVREYGL